MHICLFDIDGTLISTGGAGKAALEAALETAFDLPPVFPAVSLHGRTDRAIARDLFQHFGIHESAENWDRFRRAYLSHLPAWLVRRAGQILPGIDEAVRELSQRDDVLVGLLTGNVVAGARCKLEHFGLWDYFRCGGFGDAHVDRCDVAREAVNAVDAHLDRPCDPDRVWVIGDTPFDVRCARAVGARAVAVATGGSTRDELVAAEPDLLLDDFSEWRRMVAEW